jgi:hypothetical protein
MSDEWHNPEVIVKFAEALLSPQFDHEVRLVRDRVFSGFKSVVVRCRVESSGASLPDALIVKKAREERGCYFPDNQAAPNAAHELFNDWAAARFLDGLGHDPPLAPRFYAGDRKHGLIVLEDLGDGEAPNTARPTFPARRRGRDRARHIRRRSQSRAVSRLLQRRSERRR